jgi:hypothetical protein
MTSQETALEEVRERLRKLERQNLRLKRIGLAALILTASLLLMGQASQKRTVEANEFVLRDYTGNVRARLGMYRDPTASPAYPEEPRLALFDEKGQQSVTLTGDQYAPTLTLYDSKGHPRLNVGTGLDAGLLYMSDEHGTLKTRIKEGEVWSVNIGATHVETLDADGSEAVLGTADLVTPRTGEKHTTSAASLVLFDKNKTVIWKAP